MAADRQCGRPSAPSLPFDLDASIVVSHSGNERAAPAWEKVFGFLVYIRAPREQESTGSFSVVFPVAETIPDAIRFATARIHAPADAWTHRQRDAFTVLIDAFDNSQLSVERARA